MFDITLLQSDLVPVASGLTVNVYANPTVGMSPSQMSTYEADNTPTFTGTTDANGHLQLGLTAGTQYLFVATGYAGAYGTPSGTAALYVIVNPPSTLCKVTGTVVDATGKPQSGVTVTANLNATGPVVEGTNLILATAPSTTTAGDGTWTLDLVPNDLITTPKNTLYTFVFTQPGVQLQTTWPFYSFGAPVATHGPSVSRVVRVPNATNANFDDLV